MNKLINDDCFNVLPTIDDHSIDMILCDLPYATTNCEWDSILPFETLWNEYKRIIKPNGAIVLTASQPFTSKLIMSNLDMFKYEWIWNKNKATNFLNAKKQPLRKHESVLVFYSKQPIYNPQFTEGKPYKCKQGKQADVYNHYKRITTVNTGNRYPVSLLQFECEVGLHPTQKPVLLFEYLINTYTNEGDVVLDNCCGSGTTAIAALNTNRNYICIEQNENYYNIAKKRIENNV